jgi:hypothetical protein
MLRLKSLHEAFNMFQSCSLQYITRFNKEQIPAPFSKLLNCDSMIPSLLITYIWATTLALDVFWGMRPSFCSPIPLAWEEMNPSAKRRVSLLLVLRVHDNGTMPSHGFLEFLSGEKHGLQSILFSRLDDHASFLD